MLVFAETERLILREILPLDEEGMFALDSDPLVHRYLGNQPVTSIEQVRNVIAFIRQQYADYGIGRWAVIEKETNSFLGWSGLKYVTEPTNNHTNFYDIGYRFIRKYWGKGYASESAFAARDYAFESLKTSEIYASVATENIASRKVLEKIGLRSLEIYGRDGNETIWMQLTQKEWEERR